MELKSRLYIAWLDRDRLPGGLFLPLVFSAPFLVKYFFIQPHHYITMLRYDHLIIKVDVA